MVVEGSVFVADSEQDGAIEDDGGEEKEVNEGCSKVEMRRAEKRKGGERALPEVYRSSERYRSQFSDWRIKV